MRKRLILKIYGLVQGVNFRYFTSLYAQKLGITGFIKNNDDGTVTVNAEGEEKNLHKLLNFCYNGVKHAKVDSIDVSWLENSDEFSSFNILYDY